MGSIQPGGGFPPRQYVLIAGLLGVLLAAGSAAQEAAQAPAGDDDDAAAALVQREVVDGHIVLTLPPDALATVGIATATLAPVRRPARYEAFARVVDVAPLLEARARFQQSRATEAVLQVDLDVSRREYQRLRALSGRGSLVTEQDLNRAQGEFRRVQALVRAEQLRQASIYDEVTQAFSAVIAAQVLRDETPLYRALVDRSRMLLHVTLPPGHSLPAARPDIDVRLPSTGDGDPVISATFTSEAGATAARIQGETWYFTLPGGGLRSGMQLTALVPDGRRDEAGVLVPDAAVVWHGGLPNAYLALGDGRYSRRELAGADETAAGWFVPLDGTIDLAAGDEVVVAGATTLLSEEFRWQIPVEDDDDDD